jgi:hypothetical protein
MRYRHTQFGYWSLIAVIILLAVIAYDVYTSGWDSPPYLGILVILIMLGLFINLTISINDEKITLSYGMGLIKKSFALQDIVESYQVRNPFYYGWGIRRTPHGWLYNISGLDAVEIVLANGKKYRLGSDEPEKLSSVIKLAICNREKDRK